MKQLRNFTHDTLRAKGFANRKFRDFHLFSRKFMPSMKVSGKFGKVIFAKTELLKKITIVFVSFKSRKTAYGRDVSIFRPKGL